ncbi:hypothetical protein ACQJBY_005258 [Aegilops geniculata]
MARLSFVPISLLLLASLAGAGAGAAAAADPGEGGPRVSVQYASEEESRWLDRWTEKHLAQQGSGQAIEIQPGTDEESAQLSRMFPGNAYIGHIDFGRIVVDAFHSKARLAKPNDGQEESQSHAEHDVKDL